MFVRIGILGILRWFSAATALVTFSCGDQAPSFEEDLTQVGESDAVAGEGSGGPGSGSGDLAYGKNPGEGGEGEGGDTAGGDTAGGDTAGGDTAGGDTAGGDTAGGDTAGGDTAGGDTAGGDNNGGSTSGQEIPPNVHLVTYNAVHQAKENIDILWVVDSSGSMQEEQTFLANNFGSFMNTLVAADFDFQTAITSTDVCDVSLPPLAQRACPTGNTDSPHSHRGTFIGPTDKQVLAKADYLNNLPGLVNQFKANANVGVSGSGFEHGLTAAKMAVDKSLSGLNPLLLRENSFLSVIVVSDEEDDGIGLSQLDYYSGKNYFAEGLTGYKFTEDHLVEHLNQKVGAGNYSVSAITGTKLATGVMCSASHSTPMEEGSQYIKAAQKTGGLLLSICETNWQALLTKIGEDLKSQSTQITLPAMPYDPMLMKVYVDGVLHSEWEYVSGANAIKFVGDQIPDNGAAVMIKFYVED